ncbi:PREDICTED: zinc finger protein 91-like [Nicrophorus vespilloides]|uniref:Zinc finger protein 91-like n=1 Tax=Nicrophorus vespilloides TaxID=110193 RepID=A0ABM1N555_NICVS|nr:PREDICTED: zinc finger protein 91-like [Nicrophorus vespilloides]
MSGYKRANFYDLCRLCASNQGDEKIHIFKETGLKLELQKKIQTLFSLKVSEDDYLPKGICTFCLRNLEDYYKFSNCCYRSETMLSSYLHTYQNTEDFKESGMVYIKVNEGSDEESVKEDCMEIEKSVNLTEKNPYDMIYVEPADDPPSVMEKLMKLKSEKKKAVTVWVNQAPVILKTEKPATKTKEPKLARPFKCINCNKSFMRKEHLLRHMTLHNGMKNYTCDVCSKSFSRNDNLLKHKKIHSKTNLICEVCYKPFLRQYNYTMHRACHKEVKDRS